MFSTSKQIFNFNLDYQAKQNLLFISNLI